MIEIGSSIGRYHILEQLGQGGMATVYRAFDTRLDNEVALKILRVDIFGPAVLERLAKRFEREAKLMAGMSHRGIVKVFDYGEYNDAPYLVMELLPGGTLKDRMGKPFPYAEAARLAAQVAHALNYAHQRKHPILHRDVKPANILINEEGELVLTDFGIAKVLAESEGNSLTSAGVGIGTPEYMAPEQGLGKEVDCRADVYALGVVFYELVTGRKPFTADTPMAVILKHVTDPLPRPKLYVPDLPDQVERVIFKALAKRPEDRYQSMQEFAAAMERLIADTGPAPAKPVDFQNRPEYPATDDAETGEITRDLREGAQSTSLESVPPVTARDFSMPDRTPDPDVSTIDDNVQPSSDETPRQARRRFKPWQGLALAAVLMIAVIGIIFSSKPSPGAMPGTVELVSPTMHLGDGILYKFAYSPNGRTLATASSIGIQFYDANTLEKILFIDTESSISSIAFSPDGRILASGLDDKTIKLWDTQSGELLQTFGGHNNCVTSLAFSPGGDTLASWVEPVFGCEWSEENAIRLWDVERGTLVKTLRGHKNYVTSIAFSPDGKMLASGSRDNTVRLWDVWSGELLQTLTGHSAKIESVAYSPDGGMLASGSNDKTIRLWDAESGDLLQALEGHTNSVTIVVFSPDGLRLASGSPDNTVKLWDPESGALLQTLEGYSEGATAVAFSPDGSKLASGSFGGIIRLWDAESGALLQTLEGYSEGVTAVAFSPNGSKLASGSFGGIIRLWDAESGALLQTLEGYSEGVTSVAFSLDGSRLASGSYDPTIRLWDAKTGILLQTLEGHTEGVESVAFSSDGGMLASGSNDKTIRLWDAESGALLQTLREHTDGVTNVAFSPDGSTLASGTGSWQDSSDITIRIWNVENGKLLRTLAGNDNDCSKVAFSLDGSRVASGSWDGTIWLRDVHSGALLQTLKGHSNYVTSVAFSPDGRMLASGSRDHTIRLWDAQSGALLQTLKRHTQGVTIVAFSPDGDLLASVSLDGTIQFWDVESGKPLQTLKEYTDDVTSLSFSPDGSMLASGSNDGTIQIWKIGNR